MIDQFEPTQQLLQTTDLCAWSINLDEAAIPILSPFQVVFHLHKVAISIFFSMSFITVQCQGIRKETVQLFSSCKSQLTSSFPNSWGWESNGGKG